MRCHSDGGFERSRKMKFTQTRHSRQVIQSNGLGQIRFDIFKNATQTLAFDRRNSSQFYGNFRAVVIDKMCY